MDHGILHTGKIRLRAIEPGDVEFIVTLENDPETWKAGETLVPFSRFQIEQYVLSSQHDLYAERQLRLMIELDEHGKGKKTIGMVDLFDFDPHNRRAGIGIMILPEFRNRGFAGDAIKALARYSFEVLSLHQLHCSIAGENLPSMRVFEKNGFVQCGRRKDWRVKDGQWTDEVLYQLIRS